jgi:hypothetical protein
MDDPLPFPPCDIQIDAVESYRIGFGLTPLDRTQVITAVLHHKKVIFEQPAIQMDLRFEITEPMIGQNKKTMLATPLTHLLIHNADKFIEPFVPTVHNILAGLEEHMLHTVQVIEDAG